MPAGLAACLARRSGHVHLAGICGVGMAGLAVLLKARGLRVTGCDAAVNRLGPWLQERGIMVQGPHSPAHITPDVDWVIHTAAIKADHAELQAASARNLPVFKRGEVLPRLLDEGDSVAVAGTHGKTTTTSFIAQVLAASGRTPTFCIGGEVAPLGGVAGIGTSGIVVAEADESDGTLALYAPGIAVINNIEFDHMEHFAGVDDFEACFGAFIARARRKVVYGSDDPRAARLCAGHARGLSFGLAEGAQLRGLPIAGDGTSSTFEARLSGQSLGVFRVPAPGRHNILNALACIAVCTELGVDPDTVREALARVVLPRRRFDRLVDRPEVTVISDYAHHPSEIAALVRTASSLGRQRLLGVFQPHRYTRTLALGPDFPPAFEGLSELILTPVYAASEAPLAGGTTWDLYAHCRSAGRTPVMLATSLDQAWNYYHTQLRLGDALLVIGAGDVERIAFWARDALRNQSVEALGTLMGRLMRDVDLRASIVRGREPLASKTTLGVGGLADVWIEFGDLQDLRKILAWTHSADIPFTLLGAGSNVLVSDLGIRGITGRLAGAAFRTLRTEPGLIVAGAALPMARLLGVCEDQGLGGLEFLHQVPGTVGGAVRGNAGAWRQAVGDRVAWVRVLDRDGSEQQLSRAELDYTYRRCPVLRSKVIVEAAFQIAPRTPEDIRAEKAAIAERRAWIRDVRSAGSVFRNPPDIPAGKLLDELGMRGRRIGGARVFERHGNVIATEPGATASDVLALLETLRDTARRERGIALEPEIMILG